MNCHELIKMFSKRRLAGVPQGVRDDLAEYSRLITEWMGEGNNSSPPVFIKSAQNMSKHVLYYDDPNMFLEHCDGLAVASHILT